MAYCWRCAEKIQDAALACRFCGADQNAPERWTKPPMTPLATDMKPLHWILGGGALLLLFSLLVSVRHVPSETSAPSPVAVQEAAPPAASPLPPAGSYGNSYSAQFAQFSDAERHAMLARVVKSAGESCDGGYRTFFQGFYVEFTRPLLDYPIVILQSQAVLLGSYIRITPVKISG